MARLALELVWSDRAERRIELCDQALDLAREVGDRRVLAEVLWSRSVVVDPTRIEVFDTVMAETTETIKAARGIDDSLVCVALTWRMIHHVGRGHVAAGDEDLVEAEELADRLRIPHHVARTKALRAARLLLSGQHEATELMLADYEAYCAREGLVEGVSLANGVRFELMYQRDQAAELESSLVEWLGAQPTAVSARMGLVGIYLQTDRPELARPHIEALGADDFAMIPRNHTFLFYFPALAMSAGLSGVLDVAEAAYHHIARFDDAMPFHGYFEYPIGLSVGVAAGALGWYDRAEQHFARARDLSERAAAPLYVASTQFFWAEVLVNHARPGDAERAREMATAARATAQRLGFAHVQRRAEWLLRRISS